MYYTLYRCIVAPQYVLLWDLSKPRWLNVSLHTLQENLCLLVCIAKCLLSLLPLVNDLLQSVQEYGHSPAWVRIWQVKLLYISKTYDRHHRYMDAPWYVPADGHSDHSGKHMSYRTHHSKMDTLQNVWQCVISDCSAKWSICYKHNSDIVAPQCKYIHASSGMQEIWMLYYAYHKNMVGLLYGFVDAPSIPCSLNNLWQMSHE
jgi:hypothetical protein